MTVVEKGLEAMGGEEMFHADVAHVFPVWAEGGECYVVAVVGDMGGSYPCVPIISGSSVVMASMVPTGRLEGHISCTWLTCLYGGVSLVVVNFLLLATWLAHMGVLEDGGRLM